jgi:transcriptional regulator with XRE-family HTH domain
MPVYSHYANFASSGCSHLGSDVPIRVARTSGMTGTITDTHRYLRAWRTAKKWTLEALAEKIGSKKNTISGWENGRRRITLDDIKKIADIYEVRPMDLLKSPDGSDDDPVNQTNAEVLAAYAAIGSEEGRKAVMDMMKAMAPKNIGELPPVRINRLMGHVPLDELDIGALEQELAALLSAIRKRQAELNRPPPRPFQGGSGTENSVEDCRRVVTIPRETRKIG